MRPAGPPRRQERWYQVDVTDLENGANINRRWWDYCELLERGTHQAVGVAAPPLIDEREAVRSLLQQADITAADDALTEVWRKDSEAWRQRLRPFLDRLAAIPSHDFAELVEEGCQPDTLAYKFHRATQIEELTGHEKRVRSELDALEKLLTDTEQAIASFADRRRQFDDYVVAERLRVLEDQPGGAMLAILRLEFETS